MKKIIFCFIGLSLVLLAFNCSELKKSLPVASSGELKLHDSGWDNPESANFHGKYLDVKEYNFDECTRCHGGNYSGGTSGVSCFSCHSAYPHKAGWTVVDSASYHGKYLKSKDWNVTECQGCHGTNYTGGTSGVSCRSCHPSFPHSDNFDESNGHPVYMRTNEFPMDQCKVCHGSNYDGGTIVSSSCRGCHDNPAGPEQCNTCHGDYSGAGLIATAPPKSVDGDTATTVRGVGAHQKHLISGILGKSVKCQECHTVPSQLADAGHIDSPFNVTVAFNDTLAKLITADGSYNPQYQKSTLKCDNTFCHGNWKLRKTSSALQFAYTDSVMVGSKYSPAWTGGSSESLCGTTCHTLPPTGHISATLTGCFACHSGVIDGTGAIIYSSKHVNGKINVFGSESNFPQ